MGEVRFESDEKFVDFVSFSIFNRVGCPSEEALTIVSVTLDSTIMTSSFALSKSD